MDKLPPIEKVYEAWSAVADGRVTLHPEERQATVISSNRAKTYTVTWNEDGTVYSSNDNATYWQGYAGYPVIAALMIRGVLPLDRSIAEEFAQVDWTELNERYKRNYTQAVAAVVSERGLNAERATQAAEAVLKMLASLDIVIKRGSIRPPKTAKA